MTDAHTQVAVPVVAPALSLVDARAATRGPRPAVQRELGALATLRVRRARPQTSLDGIGREWQRMFPDPRHHPITRIEDGTVHAESIRAVPTAGPATSRGCYRMMEYDRTMAEKIGAQFVVLRSQAEPGVTACQVALRPLGASMDDLVPAHGRAGHAS